MKLTRTLMIAVLPSLLLACAGESATESNLGEIDSPEALVGSAETSGVDEEQPEPDATDGTEEESSSEDPLDTQTETSAEAEPEEVVEDSCRVADVNLNDFEAWRREAGWWVGEYTLLGADGNPSVSSRWPYRYDHYRGFIHLEVVGNAIKQRNVFLYPPQSEELCGGEEEDVVGAGTCGENGNEKVFSADQVAADCNGNLAGPYIAYGMEMATETTILGDDTVLYQVRMEDGSLMQNQLTSLPGNDTRVRTAQGFYMGNPTYASFYRERKVTEEEFFALMAETREEYQILEEDYCGRDANGVPTEKSCAEHFELDAE